jgi:hypothetical protein
VLKIYIDIREENLFLHVLKIKVKNINKDNIVKGLK